MLALAGEAGSGKSVILEFARERADGMCILRARGIQSEAQIPFACLFELLRPTLDHLDRLAPPQREALESALALRPARSHDRFAVGAATLALLASQAEEAPVLVLIDDAHWIDRSSADALLFAFRRLLADPIAVLLSVREGEESLRDGADLDVHQLTGLDRAATAELLSLHSAGREVTAEAIERLHRVTGGNPLALIELFDDSATMNGGTPVDPPVPIITSIGRVYLNRCAALPEPVRDMLLLVASSDTDQLPLLTRAAALAGLDVQDLVAAEAIGLVVIRTDRVEFAHPLIRSALYADGNPEKRRSMHRALAAVLPDADADRRAWHLALAAFGPDDAVSSALEQAGRRARSRSAYHVACQAFERAGGLAVEDHQRGQLLLAAADCAWLGGTTNHAIELLNMARHGAASDVASSVENLRGHIATRMGPVEEGRRILLEGAARAADVDPDRAVLMLAEAVNAAFYAGDASAMRVGALRIPPLMGPRSSRRTQFFAAMAQGMALIFGGDGDERGAALLREAVAIVEGSDELADDPRLLAWAAMGPLWLRESDSGRALIDRAIDAARSQAAVGVLPFLLSHVAADAMASDRWTEAEAGFHEAISLGRETGQRTDLAFGLARLAWLEARQGNAVACRSHASEARVLGGEIGLGLIEIWSLAALGDLDVGLGDPEAALVSYQAQDDALRHRRVGDVDLSPGPDLVELHLRLGDRERAESCFLAFERSAIAKGQPWSLARAARCRILLASDDDIDRHFTDALAWHARTPDVFEGARTRLVYGARLRRARHRTLAREQLRIAVNLFDRLGAAPWSDMARVELAATGETARRRHPSTRDQLSPQELRIALLLVAGRTTRETAAALFLSPKTVEYHLRNVYAKFNINSREQLALVMRDD